MAQYLSHTSYLIVAGLAPLCQGLVSLQGLVAEQSQLFHVHQLQREVQRRLQFLHLTIKESIDMSTMQRVSGIREKGTTKKLHPSFGEHNQQTVQGSDALKLCVCALCWTMNASRTEGTSTAVESTPTWSLNCELHASTHVARHIRTCCGMWRRRPAT